MITDSIKDEMKDAMRAKDTLRLEVIRGILTGFTNELVAKGRKPTDSLTDEEALAVIKRLSKQRKDSSEQYGKAGRPELAEKENAELAILEKYLPSMMSREEVEKIARAKQSELAITDSTKKGMLMSALMKDLKGNADGSTVKEVVDSLF